MVVDGLVLDDDRTRLGAFSAERAQDLRFGDSGIDQDPCVCFVGGQGSSACQSVGSDNDHFESEQSFRGDFDVKRAFAIRVGAPAFPGDPMVGRSPKFDVRDRGSGIVIDGVIEAEGPATAMHRFDPMGLARGRNKCVSGWRIRQ